MGMVATLHQITSRQLDEFLRRPNAAYDYVMDPFFEDSALVDAAEKMFAQLRENTARFPPAARAELERAAQHFQAQTQARKGPQLVKPGPEPPSERKEFSLEKDWHVLHYVLNGTHDGGSGPLAHAVLPGNEILGMEPQMDYGPLRYSTPVEVQAVATALLEVDPGALISNVNVADAQTKKIYLSHTLDDLASWSYFADFFNDFRAFYSDAARSGNAILLSIT
jgi:hypothetical protein